MSRILARYVFLSPWHNLLKLGDKQMKKCLVLSLAALSVGTANAQSSITLFGTVDHAVQNVRGDGNGSVTRMVQGGNAPSKLGFRGIEDLGGGLSASFWLEAGLNTDSGSGFTTSTNNQTSGVTGGGGFTFNRRSTVSVAGPFGEVRLGRDYSPSYWAFALVDPFGNLGVGSNFALMGALGTAYGVQTNVRASNSIGYLLPSGLGGFYGQAMYALGENASNAPSGTSDDGRHVGGRVGYGAGPIDLSTAYGRTTLVTGDYIQENIAGSYNFGAFMLTGGVFRSEIKATVLRASNSWTIGAIVPVGASQFKASYTAAKQNAAAGNNDGNMIALGYVYNLSKRTALYGAYSRIDNKGSSILYNQGRAVATPGGTATGVEVGLRHNF